MPRRAGPARKALVLVLMLAGCGSRTGPGDFHGAEGFRFTPPPGWVERARGEGPGGADMERILKERRSDLPLPRLRGQPGTPEEHLVVQYNRAVVGHKAWLRVTTVALPSAASLESLLASHAPPGPWKRASAVERLEVGREPATRLAFAGRYDGQDYLCEVVAVRKGDRVYLITASLPAKDAEGRDQVRQAVASATWG